MDNLKQAYERLYMRESRYIQTREKEFIDETSKQMVLDNERVLIQKAKKNLRELGGTIEGYKQYCIDNYEKHLESEMYLEALQSCYHYNKALQQARINGVDTVDSDVRCPVADDFKCSFLCKHYRKMTEEENLRFLHDQDMDTGESLEK